MVTAAPTGPDDGSTVKEPVKTCGVGGSPGVGVEVGDGSGVLVPKGVAVAVQSAVEVGAAVGVEVLESPEPPQATSRRGIQTSAP
jgi:hypothetical protein